MTTTTTTTTEPAEQVRASCRCARTQPMSQCASCLSCVTLSLVRTSPRSPRWRPRRADASWHRVSSTRARRRRRRRRPRRTIVSTTATAIRCEWLIFVHTRRIHVLVSRAPLRSWRRARRRSTRTRQSMISTNWAQNWVAAGALSCTRSVVVCGELWVCMRVYATQRRVRATLCAMLVHCCC
jgi:hypothetical protein